MTTPPQISPIRVLIAEDNADLRTTVISLLEAEPDIRCVAETGALGDIAQLAGASGAQLVLLDIEFQGKSSLRSLPDLRLALPGVRFLVYSGHGTAAIRSAALAAGAAGYVVKTGNPEELLLAIRQCMQS